MRPMRKILFAGLAFICLRVTPALADAMRGDAAFSAGDYALAYREWRQAAEVGDASAMTAVGTLYDTGHGVPQDFAMALAWYRAGAFAGDKRAMFNAGAMYDSGRGTAIDRAEAVQWYRKAAEKGDGRAAYNLGVIYRDGDGVRRDTTAAIKYFQVAAAAGLVAARTNLAALGRPLAPESGRNPRPRAAPPPAPSTPDELEEIARFQKAALARAAVDAGSSKAVSTLVPVLTDEAGKGNTLAQYDVGFIYEHGVGVPADPVRSYVYYLRASASSVESVRTAALKGASDVGAHLTEGQHASARDMLIDNQP